MSYIGWQKPAFQDALVHTPYLVKHKNQYYRLLTSGFVHANYAHLLFNMLTLYFFGDQVEGLLEFQTRQNGALLLLGVYIGGLIVSDLPTFVRHREHPRYQSLGASGGVSAVVFSYITLNPVQNLCLFFIFCLPGFMLAAIYLIYSWYMAKNPADHINHEAHLYGALFGILYTVYFYPAAATTFPEKVFQLRLFF
jgi:membrane associated rhomboid family serine protease